MNFTFQTTPRLICEDDASRRLVSLAEELNIQRPLIVTDAGVARLPAVAGLVEAFASAKRPAAVFGQVVADPPEQMVLQAVDFALGHRTDGVIGVGGGSSMDTAKLAALLARTPQPLESIYGIGLARGPRLPLIQVPTTAGTGSEVTPIAIVTTPSQEKKGVVSPWLLSDVAVLDPCLTLGLPPAPTAMTGIDAMVHAIEAFTTRHKKNPISDALAMQALAMLHGNLDLVLKNGTDRSARAAMLQGAMLAGIAFANAPVASVHALAYPLGGHHHIPHGHSNALVLAPVLRFNAPMAESMYAQLAQAIFPQRQWDSPTQACRAFIDEIAATVARMPFAQRLRDLGIKRDGLELLATDAMKITRLLDNNPRDLTHRDVLAIYSGIW